MLRRLTEQTLVCMKVTIMPAPGSDGGLEPR
jgi:hypothetical protein